MKYAAIGVGLFMVACGDDGPGEPGKDFTCSPEDRSGTYLATYKRRSGDCGDIAEALIRLAPNTDYPAGCSSGVPDVWSDGNCTLERSSYCNMPDGTRGDYTAISTQRDPSGDSITMLYMVTVTDGPNTVCTGTYDVTAARQ